jgi:hypothetical protein
MSDSYAHRLGDYVDEANAIRAERDRYRDALERIVAAWHGPELSKVCVIARAALDGEA